MTASTPIDTFDKYGLRPFVLLNSDVCRHYPHIIEAGKQRKWAEAPVTPLTAHAYRLP